MHCEKNVSVETNFDAYPVKDTNILHFTEKTENGKKGEMFYACFGQFAFSISMFSPSHVHPRD